MAAWAKEQGLEGNKFITMMGDPSGTLTKALGTELKHPGPQGKGLFGRTKRFAMYIDDGTVKIFKISEAADDPAGDDDPSLTMPQAMIANIIQHQRQELKAKSEL